MKILLRLSSAYCSPCNRRWRKPQRNRIPTSATIPTRPTQPRLRLARASSDPALPARSCPTPTTIARRVTSTRIRTIWRSRTRTRRFSTIRTTRKRMATAGLIYFRKALLGSAILDYTQAIRVKPDYAHAFLNRGDAHFANNETDLAVRRLQSSRSSSNRTARTITLTAVTCSSQPRGTTRPPSICSKRSA